MCNYVGRIYEQIFKKFFDYYRRIFREQRTGQILYINLSITDECIFKISKSLNFSLSFTAPTPWSTTNDVIRIGSNGSKPRLGMPAENNNQI